MKYRLLCSIFMLIFLASPAFSASTTYVYDELDRLHEVTLENGQKNTYEYDQIGNMISKTPSGIVATINGAAGPNGVISPTGATTMSGGTNKTYTITPNTGFVVTALVVDGTQLPGATSYTFTNVTANHYINAYFASAPTFTINGAAGPNGAISPTGATTMSGGTNQTYTITPNAGFTVSALVVDGTLLPGATTYTFTNVTASHYINAYFQ